MKSRQPAAVRPRQPTAASAASTRIRSRRVAPTPLNLEAEYAQLLQLPLGQPFDEGTVIRQHRKLIVEAHPDRSGLGAADPARHERAVRLNMARQYFLEKLANLGKQTAAARPP